MTRHSRSAPIPAEPDRKRAADGTEPEHVPGAEINVERLASIS
jgi:hypothetical protein